MLPLIILEVRDAALRELPLSFGNLANLEELTLNQRESVLKDLPRSFGNLVRCCFCISLSLSLYVCLSVCLCVCLSVFRFSV